MTRLITALTPADASAACALLSDAHARGEVLYKPLSPDAFSGCFFGENRWGFAVRNADTLVGFVIGTARPGQNGPMYLTLLLVAPEFRRQGLGTALLSALRETALAVGKTSLVVSGDNPVHLSWLIPGTPGHDHNNAPGVQEDTLGYPFLLARGFHDDYHEIAMHIDLRDYRWDPALDARLSALAAEGIRVGLWNPNLGIEFDGMCDRVGSEYWRGVLRAELAAWQSGQPNDNPEYWADGRRPTGPRPLLTATHEGHIIGFTGPVDLQASGRGYFTGICTDPAWGGRGIATLLFNQLMQAFIAEGATFSSLFTGRENHARKIYERAGLRVAASFCALSCSINGEAFTHRYF